MTSSASGSGGSGSPDAGPAALLDALRSGDSSAELGYAVWRALAPGLRAGERTAVDQLQQALDLATGDALAQIASNVGIARAPQSGALLHAALERKRTPRDRMVLLALVLDLFSDRGTLMREIERGDEHCALYATQRLAARTDESATEGRELLQAATRRGARFAQAAREGMAQTAADRRNREQTR